LVQLTKKAESPQKARYVTVNAIIQNVVKTKFTIKIHMKEINKHMSRWQPNYNYPIKRPH